MRRIFVISILVVSLVFIARPGFPFKKGGKGFGPKAPAKSESMDEPSGLTPVFEKGVHCEKISSAYGSTTRHDGSTRPAYRFGGRHGGMDLSLEIGTPLLAVASGKVIHKGAGDQMEGNYLWLLHLPEDTGLSFPIFIKYQHLDTLPDLEAGQAVALGQVVGLSGRTGTMDGHYGEQGYPHLHLSCIKTETGKFQIMDGQFIYKNATLIDPLIVFTQGRQKPEDGKMMMPYKDSQGRIHPEDSKTVWPVACD